VSLSSIRDRYGVPAKRGTMVTFEGRKARITSGRGHYFYLRFEGEHRPQGPFHPLWEIDYLDGVDYGARYDRRIEAFNAAMAAGRDQ
jgi:hypothetical protein